MFNMNEQLHDMIEIIARQIAADKCGLTKHIDGSNLPYELWKQCIPEAVDLLGLNMDVEEQNEQA
jgi:hypothetical protein